VLNFVAHKAIIKPESVKALRKYKVNTFVHWITLENSGARS
jgi:hypothetical protein